MGATAITVLAGDKIVAMTKTPAVAAPRGLIDGAVLLFWTFGTWLIPVLVAAEIWRHVVHHIPLRYDPLLWSIVFPIGMYGVACQYLGDLDQLSIIEHIGAYESWVALGIWALVFVGMLHHLVRTLI
jgi:tellurite resistance protein TehA-like permease